MTADYDYPVQPADETDPFTDPTFIAWSAKLEGEEDYDRGIGLGIGRQKLRDRGADEQEIEAYSVGYMTQGLMVAFRTASAKGKAHAA